MSTTEQMGTDQSVPSLSFKARLAERRKELTENTVVDIQVPVYDNLWARYRILGYEEIRGIGMRVEQETDDAVTAERLTAATTLAEACIELLEFKGKDPQGKPIFEQTGYSWGASVARDLFEIEGIPEGVPKRDALIAIFPYPRDLPMMTHFEEYLREGQTFLPEIEEVLQGESLAASAPTT